MLHNNHYNKVRTEFGVGEWAGYSYNIGIGCEHDCLYCYARADALKYGNIVTTAAWSNERVNAYKVSINEKADKRIMFPSTHDITPYYLRSYVRTLDNILSAGNEVLVVSKPHFECIEELCRRFTEYRNKIEFRFTIGTLNDEVSKFWEPRAPLPLERLKALKHACDCGFSTSVSMEPMLEGYSDALAVYREVDQHVSGTIWIGLMNLPEQRVDMSSKEIKEAVAEIKSLQSEANVMKLYRELKDVPKIRWKDSIKKIVKRRVI